MKVSAQGRAATMRPLGLLGLLIGVAIAACGGDRLVRQAIAQEGQDLPLAGGQDVGIRRSPSTAHRTGRIAPARVNYTSRWVVDSE